MDADIHGFADLLGSGTYSVEDGLDVSVVGDSSSNGRDRCLLPFLGRVLTANVLQALKVIGIDGGDVVAAEDADLEVLDRRVERGARLNQVGQSLVDDGVGANVFSHISFGAFVGNQFSGVRQVDSVDVGVSAVS